MPISESPVNWCQGITRDLRNGKALLTCQVLFLPVNLGWLDTEWYSSQQKIITTRKETKSIKIRWNADYCRHLPRPNIAVQFLISIFDFQMLEHEAKLLGCSQDEQIQLYLSTSFMSGSFWTVLCPLQEPDIMACVKWRTVGLCGLSFMALGFHRLWYMQSFAQNCEDTNPIKFDFWWMDLDVARVTLTFSVK